MTAASIVALIKETQTNVLSPELNKEETDIYVIEDTERDIFWKINNIPSNCAEIGMVWQDLLFVALKVHDHISIILWSYGFIWFKMIHCTPYALPNISPSPFFTDCVTRFKNLSHIILITHNFPLMELGFWLIQRALPTMLFYHINHVTSMFFCWQSIGWTHLYLNYKVDSELIHGHLSKIKRKKIEKLEKSYERGAEGIGLITSCNNFVCPLSSIVSDERLVGLALLLKSPRLAKLWKYLGNF